MMKNFGYQAEKLHSAVLELMLPHPNGEMEAIASALHECYLAFRDLLREDLDESAKEWVEMIEKYMVIQPKELTEDQKFELSNAVYELNAWFHMYFWKS